MVECLTRDQGQGVRTSPASLSCDPWARCIYPSLVLVHPRKTSPCLTERLFLGHKESNQTNKQLGAQWLSDRVLDSRPKGCGFEPHRRHCVVSLRKKINPSLVLVQPRKTCPYITERLLMGCKESNQTNKQTNKLRFGSNPAGTV